MKIYWNQESNSKNLIGQRVKALRIEKHMSQKALAEQLQLAGYEFSDLTVLRIFNFPLEYLDFSRRLYH